MIKVIIREHFLVFENWMVLTDKTLNSLHQRMLCVKFGEDFYLEPKKNIVHDFKFALFWRGIDFYAGILVKVHLYLKR